MIIILICCCCNGNGDSMTIDLVDDEIHGSAMIAWLVARGGGWWWSVWRWNNAWYFLVHNCSMDSSVNRDYVFVDVRRNAGAQQKSRKEKGISHSLRSNKDMEGCQIQDLLELSVTR